MTVRPDVRKSLSVLESEWTGCKKCNLGEFRDLSGGQTVFGEGNPGGIMFIGEGPGREDAEHGRPFAGPAGAVLRHTIVALGIQPAYLSNTVLCRSCVQDFDTEGNPKVRMHRGVPQPVIKDQPPTGPQAKACYPRLVEEVYAVDPKLIVALGKSAAEILYGGPVSLFAEANKPLSITIPGAGTTPALTAKKQEWVRSARGVLSLPTKQTEVSYLMIPVLPPSFVLSKQVDQRLGNPLAMFLDGIKMAAKIYARYMFEVYGTTVLVNDVHENDIKELVHQ